MVVRVRRTLTLTAGGLTAGEGLRVTAQIQRPSDPTQNTCDIRLYNLDPGTERRIHERGGPATLTGGYDQQTGVLFAGDIQRIRRVPTRTAHILAVTIGDRIHSPQHRGGISCRSYAGPYPTRQIIQDLATDIDLGVGPLNAIPNGHTLTDWAWTGQTSRALTEAASAADCVWYEEDGLIRIRSMTSPAQADAPTFLISPTRGLIRAPVETDEGAQAVLWCQPAIRRGSRLLIGPNAWTVSAIRHNLDSWAGPFTTICDLRVSSPT